MFLLIYSQERNCIPLYLKKYTNIIFFLNRIYSANIIWCLLLIRYTSIQSYKMLLEDFPLPSLSLLNKIIKRKIDLIKYAQALIKDSKISQDIYLLFDEMYLQKCEEYFGSELIGSDENGELDKEIVCFTIRGMKESISWDQVISRNNNAVWIRDEIFECLDVQIESQWKKFLFHILNSFELFTWKNHKEKGQKFANLAVIHIYFNNK